jgi:hypothetical protein
MRPTTSTRRSTWKSPKVLIRKTPTPTSSHPLQ